MTLEETLDLIEQAVEPKQLNKIQQLILQYSWQGYSYTEIAKATGYDCGYIKDAGSKLWQMLSNSFGEKVNKQNCQAILKRYFRQKSQPLTKTLKIESLPPSQDWGEATDTSIFYGRSREVTTLSEWIVKDKCRLIAVLGMGGIGKTTLSVKVTEEVQEAFECLFWRSLRDAPPLSDLLTVLLQFLSKGEGSIATTESGKLSQLLEYLRLKRCLIVLDNFDAVFASGQRVGVYREGYEGYGELLKRVGESRHKSCMVITSRDKPSEIAFFRGESLPVRELSLRGLEAIAAHKLLIDKGLQGSEEDLDRLVECYQGNPLALKITATSICDLFDCYVADFLKQKVAVFNGIRHLLKQQIDRLCALEEQVMYWLAINRESVEVKEIQADLVPCLPLGAILEVLESLRWRSLVEKTAEGFTQQPVVLEYMTELLIDRVCNELINFTEFIQSVEIRPPSPPNLEDAVAELFPPLKPSVGGTGIQSFSYLEKVDSKSSKLPPMLGVTRARGIRGQTPTFLNHYAILKATSKDYIRDSQKRTIVEPIIKSAIASLGSKEALVTKLKQLLKQFHLHQLDASNYAVGNLLNLFNYLEVDLTGFDFSGFSIWQAYLADVKLQQVNFSGADFCKSVFAETFGGISCIAFSPDGQLLTTSDTSGKVQLWELSSGRELHAFRSDTVWTWTIAFSPDGQMLASAGDDRTVKVWDIKTGQCLKQLEGHTQTINAIAFHSTRQILASCSQDTTIRLWQVNNIENPLERVLEGHQGRVWAIAFNPDGNTLVSGSEDCTLKLWDINTGKCLVTLSGHDRWIKSVAFSPDGEMLVSGSFEGLLKLWDLTRQQCIQTWQGHQGTVTDLSFSPDGRYFASSSYDQLVKVWDITSQKCLQTLKEHSNRVWTVAFSPDGQYLASGGDDHATRLWHLRSGQCAKAWKGHTNSVLSLSVSAKEQLLATGHEDQTIKLWSLKTGKVEQTLQGHTNRVWSVAFAPQYLDKDIIASGSADRTIKLWNIKTGKCLKTFYGHNSWVWSVAFSPIPSSPPLASASYDHSIKLWDVESGECLQTLNGHGASVVGIAYSRDGQWLASSSFDTTIKLWEVKTGECFKTLEGHQNSVWAIAFSPDGNLLASCSYDRTIKLWDLNTKLCLYTFEEHQAPVMAIAFDATGQQLISGSFDRTIKVWDIETKRCLNTLHGHTGAIYSLTHSFGTIFSGGFDETVRLWHVKSGECLQVLRTPCPYDGMNIKDASGLTDAQRQTLNALGATEHLLSVAAY